MEVPMLDSAGRVVCSSAAWKNNGKWEIAITGLSIPPDFIKLSSDNELISQLLNDNDLSKFKELKHVRIWKMDALYVLSELGDEYIIPMSHRPDLIGLENLKVNTAGEAMKVLTERVPKANVIR